MCLCPTIQYEKYEVRLDGRASQRKEHHYPFKTKMFDARVGATEQHLSEQYLRNPNPRC
jgi:hypothetical protein